MQHTDDHGVELSENYEHSDAKARPIIAFAIGTVVLAIVSFAISVPIINLFETISDSEKVQAAGSPLYQRELPPEPRLQARPWEELTTYQAEQERLVSTYGWVDKAMGRVRIPIDRAIELAAERGFEVRVESPAEPSDDTTQVDTATSAVDSNDGESAEEAPAGVSGPQ